jgi:hypothetical protein
MVKKEFVKVISESPVDRAEFLPAFPSPGAFPPTKGNPQATPSSGLGGIQAIKIIKL